MTAVLAVVAPVIVMIVLGVVVVDTVVHWLAGYLASTELMEVLGLLEIESLLDRLFLVLRAFFFLPKSPGHMSKTISLWRCK